MADLPETLWPYFHALENGLEGLLPEIRVRNKALLLTLQAAIEAEERLTASDLAHLKFIISVADRVTFTPIRDVQSCCEAEAYLIKACPSLSRLRMSLMLRWLFLLLARHGRVNADLAEVSHWFQIWRTVQTFPALEQGLLSDFIQWMESKTIATRTMADILREIRKLKAWMDRHGLAALGKIGNLELQRYLLERASGQTPASKQKIIGQIKTLLYYYQEAIDPAYRVPDYTIKTARPLAVNSAANSEEIKRLIDALQTKQLPALGGLMLTCVIGYGLPLKLLPLLELTGEPGLLVCTERLPCRRGKRERSIRLHTDLPWLSYYWHAWMLEREEGDACYLFTTGHGSRRGRPVSLSHCQRTIQTAVQSILGYSIQVNHLERGAMKRLARLNTITRFMLLTSDHYKGRLTRMIYYLAMSARA